MESFNFSFQEIAERAPFLATLTTILKVVCYRGDAGEYLIEAQASVTKDYRGRYSGHLCRNPGAEFRVDQDIKNWCTEGLAVKYELEDVRLPVAKIMPGVVGDEIEKDSLHVFVWVSRSQLCQISPGADTTKVPDFSTLPKAKRPGFLALKQPPRIQQSRNKIKKASPRTKRSDVQKLPRRSARLKTRNGNSH
ncbi:uncharacterized protein N7473_011085 [Penicillium subrubescens]|uniref:uncharacterized protein n=1 Tax=Penicillium subrubescens TaxID=1316194 RepID=UPI0025455303|nr:uncharacterized protein N7473_011085 [Penicillium subrubescens]KAJ5882823.1 hypothetical protein N7473_011085 [Penicillium subrubescens]